MKFKSFSTKYVGGMKSKSKKSIFYGSETEREEKLVS
jgi:hypothetical protein